MGNIKRHFETGYPYFVTTIVRERRPIFSDEKTCRILLTTIEHFKLILGYKIYAYCIMPDHLHLIVHPCGKYELSYIMQMIKGSFAREFNKINNSSGNIWQKRFYDEGIRDTKMLMQKIEYVHNNPIRENLVISLENYAYSSYHHYFGINRSTLGIDQLDY
jgi:putative transposase